jgi:hypothetical protein
MSDKKVFTYPGQSADVSWDDRLSIATGECDKSDGGLLQGGPPLWSQPGLSDAGSVQLRAALCRWGQSKNKPFCDGSHTAAGGEAP